MDFLENARLPLSAYFQALGLRNPYPRPRTPRPETPDVTAAELLRALRERPALGDIIACPPDDADGDAALRVLLAAFRPGEGDAALLRDIDSWLWRRNSRGLLEAKRILPAARTHPGSNLLRKANIALWLGDIEKIAAGAVIKPACTDYLGCRNALHGCLDSRLHFAAGPQLRGDLRTLLALQGFPEAPGIAKITRGYNLPAMYVVHVLLPESADALATTYERAFELATRLPHIHTLATPLLGAENSLLPLDALAKICVETADAWMNARQGHFEKIILCADNPREFDALVRAANEEK